RARRGQPGAVLSGVRSQRSMTRGAKMKSRIAVLSVAFALVVLAPAAIAEVSEIKVARQFGISFLPILVMEDKQLFEKHAKAAGLDSKATYMQISGGTTMNDALLARSIDVAGGGIAPFAILWARTRGTNNEVKAIAAKNCAPILLLTREPRIQSIRDFTD